LRHFLLRGFAHVELARLCGERAVATHAIDRAIACGRHQPGARTRRHPFSRPALCGDRERLLRGFLGEVEVAEEADQRREYTTPLLAEDLLEAQGSTADR
jgi:hypothetical protein